jgi:hypothetical protein
VRLRGLIGFVLVAPAVIAGGTLMIFLAAGLLIAIAGHGPAPVHPRPRVVTSPPVAARQRVPIGARRVRSATTRPVAP